MDTEVAVRVSDRGTEKRVSHYLQRPRRWYVRRHPICMHKDVLVHRVSTHGGQINKHAVTGVADADYTIGVNGDSEFLPSILQTIAITVGYGRREHLDESLVSAAVTVVIVVTDGPAIGGRSARHALEDAVKRAIVGRGDD